MKKGVLDCSLYGENQRGGNDEREKSRTICFVLFSHINRKTTALKFPVLQRVWLVQQAWCEKNCLTGCLLFAAYLRAIISFSVEYFIIFNLGKENKTSKVWSYRHTLVELFYRCAAFVLFVVAQTETLCGCGICTFSPKQRKAMPRYKIAANEELKLVHVELFTGTKC